MAYKQICMPVCWAMWDFRPFKLFPDNNAKRFLSMAVIVWFLVVGVWYQHWNSFFSLHNRNTRTRVFRPVQFLRQVLAFHLHGGRANKKKTEQKRLITKTCKRLLFSLLLFGISLHKLYWYDWRTISFLIRREYQQRQPKPAAVTTVVPNNQHITAKQQHGTSNKRKQSPLEMTLDFT